MGFTRALHGYIGELAQIMTYGRSTGIAPDVAIDHLFGDSRKRVDVTFHVADGAHAHVTGAIDYVFYDWRVKSHRIIDYKLTPATHPNKDLFQIYTYALMHHHQHGTRPRVTVFYLHPERVPIERSWETVEGEQHKVYSLLASMVGWARYDEKTRTGLKPPGDLTYCTGCRWNKGGQCEARLGPKQEGDWDHRWEKLGASNHAAAPSGGPGGAPDACCLRVGHGRGRHRRRGRGRRGVVGDACSGGRDGERSTRGRPCAGTGPGRGEPPTRCRPALSLSRDRGEPRCTASPSRPPT